MADKITHKYGDLESEYHSLELKKAEAAYGKSFKKDLHHVISELRSHWIVDDYHPGKVSEDPIEKSSLAELKNKIAHAVRAEHFCTGSWMGTFQTGQALKFFERLQELGETVDSEAYQMAQKANEVFNSI